MKRILITAITGVVLSIVTTGTVSAQSNSLYSPIGLQIDELFNIKSIAVEPKIIALEQKPEPQQEPKPDEPKPDEPKPIEPAIYKVQSGDSLVKIAEKHNIEWLRLWQKNTDLTNPDVITVGQELLIPAPDEKLEDRPLPVQQPAPAFAATSQSAAQPTVAYNSSGNTYGYGYCTYGVASWVSVPNNWGNANMWAYNASAQGYTVSSVPRVGAVAQTTAGSLGHVALVIGVGNGTVTVKEMNYAGWNVTSTRTTSVSSWVYIYL